jgi:hypothetical protein
MHTKTQNKLKLKKTKQKKINKENLLSILRA